MYGTDPADSFADQVLGDMLASARAARDTNAGSLNVNLSAGGAEEDRAPLSDAHRAHLSPNDPHSLSSYPMPQTFQLEVLTRDPAEGVSQGKSVLPDLLFVHGAWHGAWCWAQIQAMCAVVGFRSHAVSLRGHGGSSGHDQLARVHLDDYVADVAQVARKIAAPFILIGHCLGGIVAQRYLSLIDQGQEFARPEGVALLATALPTDMALAAPHLRMARHYGGFLRTLALMSKMQLVGDTAPMVATPELVGALFFTKDTPTQEVMDCFSRLQNESITVLREVRRLARSWYPPVANMVPCLVLGGAQDACVDPVALKRLAGAYSATLRIFVRMGHDLMLDRGWEQVAETIIEWAQSLVLTTSGKPASTTSDRPPGIPPLHSLRALDATPQIAPATDTPPLRGTTTQQWNGCRPESIH